MEAQRPFLGEVELFLFAREVEERKGLGLGGASELGRYGGVGELEETELGRGGEEVSEEVVRVFGGEGDEGRRGGGGGGGGGWCGAAASGDGESWREAVEKSREDVGGEV